MKSNTNNTSKKSKDYAIIITALIIGLIIVITVFYSLFFKPKPDYTNFNKVIVEYVNNIGNVTNIRKSKSANDIYYITVADDTWKGTEIDKVSYCDTIRKTFTAYAWDYNIINKNNTISVIFENSSGVRLAEPDGISFGKYKIYY